MNPAYPVLWVDPGKVTGIACWWPGTKPLIIEANFEAAAHVIDNVCDRSRAGWLRVGWEHFTIGGDTHKHSSKDAASAAIEMIGVTRWAAVRNHHPVIGPAMPEQRNKATQKMLEAIGWWVPGKDDAQSAAQHLLSWMLRTGMVPNTEAVILAELRSR